jgi:hypothetical protein
MHSLRGYDPGWLPVCSLGRFVLVMPGKVQYAFRGGGAPTFSDAGKSSSSGELVHDYPELKA